MTARILICCDGTPAERPTIATGRCRAFLPSRAGTPLDALVEAILAGWSRRGPYHLCPGCTRASQGGQR